MNFENLKKQSKSLLRQHRNRYYPAAARIRRSLPKVEAMSDRDVLDSPLGLHDAQQVVAAENGFPDWATLKQERLTMSNQNVTLDTARATPHLSHAQPQLPASDVTRLAEFYREKLGFTIDYLYGEPAFYGLVSRDGAHLNLRKLCAEVIDRDVQKQEQFLSAAIPTENVKSLFLEYQETA
ncbi:MAG: VOC family protein [Planctomycetota bacterium]